MYEFKLIQDYKQYTEIFHFNKKNDPLSISLKFSSIHLMSVFQHHGVTMLNQKSNRSNSLRKS